MKFSLIAAATPNGGIGYLNTIPWHIPSDLKYFSQLTKNPSNENSSIVIMGRRTWESLPRRPLPSRINVIISTAMQHLPTSSPSAPIYVVKSLADAHTLATSLNAPSFIIGGAQLYEEAIQFNMVYKIYLTRIHNYEGPLDIFSPSLAYENISKYTLISESDIFKENGIIYSNLVYSIN